MSDINQYLEKMGNEFVNFRNKYDKKFSEMEAVVDQLETHAGRMAFSGGGSRSGEITSASAREHRGAFEAWVRKGSDPEGLRGLEVQAGLSTLSDPDGGYLVPVEIEKNIERLALASVAMRRIARIVTSKGEYTKPLSKGGATGGWVSELQTRTETDTPDLTLFSPPMCEIYAMPSISQKLLDMSDFDVESWLIEEINDVFVATEGTGFITGDGVGKVHGIIDETLMVADASWAYRKTGFLVSGHATLLNNADKLIDLQHALKPVYRQNGTWLMNDSTFNTIRKFKDGSGNYLVVPGLVGGAPDTLLGKPVEIDENMPNIGANAYAVAFGDFKRAYTIVDHESGIRLLRDPFTVKGKVCMYTTKRLAAGISNYEAVKFLKISV